MSAYSLNSISGSSVADVSGGVVDKSKWPDVIYKGDDNYYLSATSQPRPTAVTAGGGIMGGSYGEAFAPSTLPVNV